jgi:hypothetical protein
MLVWWLNAFLSFCDARFERHRRGRGLPQECIRRNWNTLSTSLKEGAQGHSYSRQAIYLLHIWILLLYYALLTPAFLFMHCFLYCYWSLDSNSWWLSSTSQLDIIHWDDTYYDLFNTPHIRDLMVSIKVFGKLVVEPKTLGLGLLSGIFLKMVSKTLE